MKKFSILALTFLLTATLFAGCRRNPGTTGPSDTGANTTAPSQTTTQSTTLPHTSGTKPSTGILPDATDLMPEMPDGTTSSGYARRVLPPRY